MKIAVALASLVLSMPAAGEGMGESGVGAPPQVSKAEKRATELDKLFAKLHKKQAGAEAQIFELWLQSESPTADVLLGQSVKAIIAKEFASALPMLDVLINSYPDYAEARNKRAALHFAQGEKEMALSDIAAALELEPRHFGALLGRGMIYHDMGRDKEALAAYREALAINPEMESVKSAIKELEKSSPDI
jgi:tetratricopeptide (TPR) repeat protein